MATVQIVQGFSLLNRWLLYTSLMIVPAQFLSGWKSNCPSNIGFLAYNVYTQVQWYQAVRSNQMHALSMLLVHYNTVCAFTYWGGITSGNYFMAAILGLGSASLIILNNVSGWISWITNQPEGFGVYRFFFFGWRTLTPGWHKFLLVWQISDSMESVTFAIIAIGGAFYSTLVAKDSDSESDKPRWWWRYPMIPIGAAIMLFVSWPLILWMELLVHGNNIESATDWVAVWLFIVQIVTMIVPSCGL